jgi:lipase chaperone LimK
MKLRRSAILSIAILAVAGLTWLFRPSALAPVFTGRDGAVERTERRDRQAAVAEHRQEVVEALRPSTLEAPAKSEPKSLRGTNVDGSLPTDANGHLIITPSVRQFFDYFFIATGEARLADIRATIIGEIEARLDEPARGEAIELLDRYIEYRESGRGLMEEGGVPGDLGPRLEQIRQLRRASFGNENADALFADEEARDYVALAERQIAGDASLSDPERAELLEGLEAQLPEAERAARAAPTGPRRLARDEAKLREQGASPEELHSLREERYGAEAADRLAELDRRRAEWQQRLEEYRRQCEAIEADASQDEAERKEAVDALLTAHFTEAEQLRVRALDRIRDEAVSSLP